MTESTPTGKILKALNALPRCKAIKLHGSRFQEAGTPDILCVWQSRAFLLEVKRPGKYPTPIQARRLLEWRHAGATTGVVRSAEEALEIMGART